MPMRDSGIAGYDFGNAEEQRVQSLNPCDQFVYVRDHFLDVVVHLLCSPMVSL